MSELPKSAMRLREEAHKRNLPIEIVELPQSTRSAAEAAQACGCDVAQIVKSLVFVGATSGRPYLLLVSGANRVDEQAMLNELGEPLERPDGRRVREITGYAIGGIPPFGHATEMETLVDAALLEHDVVWAAAGTPNCVFSVDPATLAAATGGRTSRFPSL